MNEDPAQLWEANAETWTRHVRRGFDVDRDHHNTPAFLAFLPPVRGLTGVDIGCGEGYNTRAVATLGARMSAIDVAPTFVRYAREAEAHTPLGITYDVADAAALPFPDASFDFATAFMSLMDVADPGSALREARRVVRPGGFLQFSILHPCSHHRSGGSFGTATARSSPSSSRAISTKFPKLNRGVSAMPHRKSVWRAHPSG